MIGQLTGKVYKFEDYIILDVNDVGYLVYCSQKDIHNFIENEKYKLFIETHVREDHITLYGFSLSMSKNIFNILLSVSGVGPKMALSILSNMSYEDIISAINNQHHQSFQVISGIGPKLATRIVIELKDKVKKLITSYNINKLNNNICSHLDSDLTTALINLGITKQDAQRLSHKIITQNPNLSLDELIRLALQSM